MQDNHIQSSALTPFVALLATGVAVGAFAGASGCSEASPPGPEGHAGATDVAPVATVAAQPATRSALGVAEWRFFGDGAEIDHVDGVDADGHLVVTVELRVTREKLVVDGVEQEIRVVSLATSNGGLVRVTEDGTVLESAPDPKVFTAIATDIEPTMNQHPDLKPYDCSWLGWGMCYATCAMCATNPVSCLFCGGCTYDCFF